MAVHPRGIQAVGWSERFSIGHGLAHLFGDDSQCAGVYCEGFWMFIGVLTSDSLELVTLWIALPLPAGEIFWTPPCRP